MIANFGFDSLDEALQYFGEKGLPVAEDDAAKLTATHNVTTQDLAALGEVANTSRSPEAVRPRYAEHEDSEETKNQQPSQERQATPVSGSNTPKREIDEIGPTPKQPVAKPVGKPTRPTKPTQVTPPTAVKPVKEPMPALPTSEVEPEIQPPSADLPRVRPSRRFGSVLKTFTRLVQLAKSLKEQNREAEAAEVRQIIAKHSQSKFAASAFSDQQIISIKPEQVIKGDFVSSKVEGFFRVDDISSDDTNYYFHGPAGARTVGVQIPKTETIEVMRKKVKPVKAAPAVTASSDFPIRVAGDVGELFKDLKLEKKEQHNTAKHLNTEALKAAGVAFQSANNGECLMLRNPKKPAVDFYPSTGRWRPVGYFAGQGGEGGAKALLEWYWKQDWPERLTMEAQVDQIPRCNRPGCKGRFGQMDRNCGARICDACGNHKGLERCFCGWSLTNPGHGREELEEAGETIDPN